MRIAIPIFKKNVTPRLDITDSLLVYHIDNSRIACVEKYVRTFEQPGQLISFLKEYQVEKLIFGGCPGFFMRMLQMNNIDIIYGIIGSPDDAIEALMKRTIDQMTSFSPETCRGGGQKRRQRGNAKEKNCPKETRQATGEKTIRKP